MWPGLPSPPRRPAAAATSGRAFSAASPPAPPAQRLRRHVRPRRARPDRGLASGGVDAGVTHSRASPGKRVGEGFRVARAAPW